MKNKSNIFNAISFDVEDWYYPDFSIYGNYSSRVNENTIRILEIMKKYNVKGTFFIVGMLAEKLPQLVKRITAEGHEIGTHSYAHRLIYNMTPKEFKEDLKKSIDILEQISGQKILGHRAPSASITKKSLWALDILGEVSLKYDCSIFPTKNFLYGIPDSPRIIHWANDKDGGIVEFPFTTYRFLGINIPIGGGFYLRLFPYFFTRYCVKKINKMMQPAMVYVHPKELDLNPPRFKVSLKWRLIYYYNLKSTERKFTALLSDFNFAPVKDIVKKWIDEQK